MLTQSNYENDFKYKQYYDDLLFKQDIINKLYAQGFTPEADRKVIGVKVLRQTNKLLLSDFRRERIPFDGGDTKCH